MGGGLNVGGRHNPFNAIFEWFYSLQRPIDVILKECCERQSNHRPIQRSDLVEMKARYVDKDKTAGKQNVTDMLRLPECRAFNLDGEGDGWRKLDFPEDVRWKWKESPDSFILRVSDYGLECFKRNPRAILGCNSIDI